MANFAKNIKKILIISFFVIINACLIITIFLILSGKLNSSILQSKEPSIDLEIEKVESNKLGDYFIYFSVDENTKNLCGSNDCFMTIQLVMKDNLSPVSFVQRVNSDSYVILSAKSFEVYNLKQEDMFRLELNLFEKTREIKVFSPQFSLISN